MVNKGLTASRAGETFLNRLSGSSADALFSRVSAMTAARHTTRPCEENLLVPTYKAPVDNVLFLLNEVLGYPRHANLPGFAEAPPETVTAVLAEGAQFAEAALAQLNRRGDVEGCSGGEDGSVRTPAGFKEAYRRYA